MKKFILMLLMIMVAFPLSAQDMKNFSFHVDSNAGSGTEGDVTGLSLVGVTLTGSVSSNRVVVFEVADSIGTFSVVKCTDIDTLSVVSGITIAGSNVHRYQCPVGGFKKFRVRISGGSTGTISAVGLGIAKIYRGTSPTSTGGGSALTIQELDGSPTGIFSTLKVPNTTLIDNNDGSAIFDVPSQSEFDSHTTATTVHGATNLNTPNRIVLRDPSGNFSATTITANLVGNASTSSALSNDPVACLSSPQQVVIDFLANGTLVCQQLTFGDLGGIASDAQIPDLNTLSTGLTPSRCVETDGTGKLGVSSNVCSAGGGGITGATNRGIVVATGATTATSLPVAASGQIPIGSTGANPVLGVIAGTTNQVQITNGPGTIQIAIPSNPTLPGTTTGVFSGPLSGNSSTSTALAANPADCVGPTFAQSIDAQGNLGCNSIDFSQLTGVASDAQIPDIATLTTGLTPSRCVETDGTGKLGVAAGACGISGGSTGISGATNHGIMVATGGTTGGSLGVASNGQLPIGSSGVHPVLGTITGTTNQLQVTNGPGTIQLGIPTNPTFPGTTTGTFSGPLSGNSTTATALAANGTNCIAGQFPLGVDTLGASENCTALPTTISGTTNQIASSAPTGAIVLSIPNNPTLPGTTTGSFSGPLSGNATTSTALAANGANCSAGQFPLGVDASGISESCTALPTTINGTSNQIAVSASTGPVVLSISNNPILPGVTTGSFSGPLAGNATTATNAGIIATEVDGIPSATFTTLKFSNGTVTNNGDGSATITTGASSGGDFSSNTATSVDNEVLLFSGTTGKIGKRATLVAPVVKSTNGILSASVAGIDYADPALANVFTHASGQTMKKLILSGSTGTLTLQPPTAAGTSVITLPVGSTDFTATGGTSNVLRQSSMGSAITVSALTKTDVGLDQVDNTSDTIKNSNPKTLTNTAVAPRVPACTVVLGTPNTVTPNADAVDLCIINALTVPITINLPTFTAPNPRQGQYLEFRITSAAAQALVHASGYDSSSGFPLPTLTSGGGTEDHFGYRYNTDTAKWVLIASTQAPVAGITTLNSSTTYTCPPTSNACEMRMTSGTPGTITMSAPGTAGNGKMMMLRVMCTAIGQTIAMTTGAGGFAPSPNVPLLTSCPVGSSAWIAAGAIYSDFLNRWQVYATN